jgi:hypothetical protein
VATIPGDPNLFHVANQLNNPLLPDNIRELFHSIVRKLLYLRKRIRSDISSEVAFLTKRVPAPQRDDYDKLVKTIKYIRGITLYMNDPIRYIEKKL